MSRRPLLQRTLTNKISLEQGSISTLENCTCKISMISIFWGQIMRGPPFLQRYLTKKNFSGARVDIYPRKLYRYLISQDFLGFLGANYYFLVFWGANYERSTLALEIFDKPNFSGARVDIYPGKLYRRDRDTFLGIFLWVNYERLTLALVRLNQAKYYVSIILQMPILLMGCCIAYLSRSIKKNTSEILFAFPGFEGGHHQFQKIQDANEMFPLCQI